MHRPSGSLTVALAIVVSGIAQEAAPLERRHPGERRRARSQVEESVPKKKDDHPSGSKRRTVLLVAGGIVVAGGAAYLLTRDGLTAGAVEVTPKNTGIASLTTFAFSAPSASGQSDLTFTWQFGDGSDASGREVAHVYQGTGSFEVRLTVSAGKRSAVAVRTVMVRDVTGTWTSTLLGSLATCELVQSGTRVTGSLRVPGIGSISTVSGSLVAPRDIHLTASISGRATSFEAGFNDQVTAFTGTATIAGLPLPVTFARQ